MTSTPSRSSASSTASPPVRGRGVIAGSMLVPRCYFLGLEPRHQLAEFDADLLDRVLRRVFAELVERRLARRMFGHPLLGEVAGLDLFEDLLHRRLGLVVDDARTAGVVAILRRVADAAAHAFDAALVH